MTACQTKKITWKHVLGKSKQTAQQRIPLNRSSSLKSSAVDASILGLFFSGSKLEQSSFSLFSLILSVKICWRADSELSAILFVNKPWQGNVYGELVLHDVNLNQSNIFESITWYKSGFSVKRGKQYHVRTVKIEYW